jgi:hypothetical protein
MLELRVFTTDETFVEDLNAAGIEGVRADYRPTMAYDSAEHVYEIVIGAASGAALKFAADWIMLRLKKQIPSQMVINNCYVKNSENVTIIINNYVSTQNQDKT